MNESVKLLVFPFRQSDSLEIRDAGTPLETLEITFTPHTCIKTRTTLHTITKS